LSEFGQLEGLAVVFDHLELYAEGLRVNALLAAGEIAELLANYAKTHHPWKPETGATNVSTAGTVVDGGEIIEIYLSAGMDYDVFLELAKKGKWSWLWPALEANKERLRKILVTRLGNGRAAE